MEEPSADSRALHAGSVVKTEAIATNAEGQKLPLDPVRQDHSCQTDDERHLQRQQQSLEVKPSVVLLHQAFGDKNLTPMMSLGNHPILAPAAASAHQQHPHHPQGVIIFQGSVAGMSPITVQPAPPPPSASSVTVTVRTPAEEAERERRRSRQRELNRNRMRMKRAMLSVEEREEERRINRERMRRIRAEMPDDEHEKLKMKRREEARLRRAMESPEQRQARLQARSGHKRRKRSNNPRGGRSRASASASSSSSSSLPADGVPLTLRLEQGDVVSLSVTSSASSAPPSSSATQGTALTTSAPSAVVSLASELTVVTAVPSASPGVVGWTPHVTHSSAGHAHHLVPNLPIFPGCGLTEVRGSWIDYSALPMTRP